MPCLPGLIELSPEELRVLAHIAKSSGSPTAFLQNMEELSRKQLGAQDCYMNISTEQVKKLVSFKESCIIINIAFLACFVLHAASFTDSAFCVI